MSVHSRPSSGNSRAAIAKAIATILVLGGAISLDKHMQCRADEIVMRGGGRVQGKMVDDPKQPGRVLIWLTHGRNPLSFAKSQVSQVIPQPSVLDEYVARRTKSPATPEGQFELGTWCAAHKLEDLSRSHLEAAVQLDPANEAAHLKLGHTMHNRTWRTRDEMNTINGMVKHNGRWITADAKAKHETHSQLNAAETSWLRRVRVMHQGLLSGPDDRRREAESQLMAIREADAVAPLVRVFGTDERPRRLILGLVLGSIPDRQSTTAMVRQILSDPDAEVRAAFFDQLKTRDRAIVLPQLVRALGSSDTRVINRAAAALGNLDAIDAVPKLVSVLVSTQSEIVMDAAAVDIESYGPISEGAPMPLLGLTRSGIAAYLTPPVVGPGAVAYGGVVGPFFGTNGQLSGPTFGPGMVPSQLPDARLATYSFQNIEVLTALQRLTTQDFGFDVDAWRQWVSRSFNPNARPARRVNQP